jgi:hypothetical protein
MNGFQFPNISRGAVFTGSWGRGRILTEAIAQEIMKHGIDVRLRPAVSTDQDLGLIAGSTIEVIEEPTEPTIASFTLCHLFGHLIQFADPERYNHLVRAVSKALPILLGDAFWQEFYAYEREAFGYGAALLESAVPADAVLKGLYSNFMEVDFLHFRSVITTGERPNRSEYLDMVRRRYQSFPETPAIEPLLIPNVDWSRLKGVEATIY